MQAGGAPGGQLPLVILRSVVLTVWVSVLLPTVSGQGSPTEPTARLGIAVRSTLLDPFVNSRRTESESVAKNILGNDVRGCQSTITNVSLRLIPDPMRVRLELISTGQVSSETRGLNPQTVVDSVGQHWFQITKPVVFDGRQLLTQAGYGMIRAHQVPVRVMSSASGLPLIGPVADQVAMQEVLRRSPLIDQAVAVDLSKDILPKVDRQTDSELAALDRTLKQIRLQAERDLQLPSDQWKASSTSDAVVIWNSPDSVPTALSNRESEEDVVLCVSETYVTRLLNRLIPADLVLSDTQLNNMLQSSTQITSELSDAAEFDWTAVAGQLLKLSDTNAPAAVFSLKMHPESPFTVLFSEGYVRIRSTFQVLPTIGTPSGFYTTEAAFRGTQADSEHWSVVSSNLTVFPSAGDRQNRVAPEDPQLLLNVPLLGSGSGDAVWIPLIRTTTQSLLDKLPQPKLSRTFDAGTLDERLPVLRLHRIRARQGYLRISWTRKAELQDSQ